MTIWTVAYLAVLWGLHREKRCSLIADALAANWAICQLVVILNQGWPILPLFIVVDLLTGLWLTMEVGTTNARRTAAVFLPMIAFNAATYAAGTTPQWHWGVLSVISWLQVAVVWWGVWGHGVVEAFNHPASSVRLSLARVAHLFTRGHQ